ncbi:hypothetical protein CEXT_209341 [Caerostris extrusa]|uniref:Uncharacterized protein n=1 Tax=Caerostris extrusa TaxID=172846 RepID=A0AAV4TZN7_CAEEX|nr:hypothetical protein CEXT_209341 [Caerostris extrusa]
MKRVQLLYLFCFATRREGIQLVYLTNGGLTAHEASPIAYLFKFCYTRRGYSTGVLDKWVRIFSPDQDPGLLLEKEYLPPDIKIVLNVVLEYSWKLLFHLLNATIVCPNLLPEDSQRMKRVQLLIYSCFTTPGEDIQLVYLTNEETEAAKLFKEG